MAKQKLEFGDLVIILRPDWKGTAGIVTQPITLKNPGHVLVHRDGCILGISVSLQDVLPAEKSDQGFIQLGYLLLNLSSHFIEDRLT